MSRRRKKGYFKRMWWKIRHPLAWGRVLNMDELHKKRIILENIQHDYEENKEYYDREFEKEFHREWKELTEGKPKKLPPVVWPALPPVNIR